MLQPVPHKEATECIREEKLAKKNDGPGPVENNCAMTPRVFFFGGQSLTSRAIADGLKIKRPPAIG